MKPAPFHHHAPTTLAEATELLTRLDDAKVLAGGQSLVPALNMRLAQVGHLVDLGALTDPELREVRVEGGEVVVGALVTHTDLERHDGAAAALPLLRETLHHVAHPAIRNRGTTVGSIVHADPNGEMPSILTLLGGSVDVVSARQRRTIAAADLFVGPMESCLEPDEIAVAARFPVPPEGTVCAYDEFARRSGDYAMAGVGVCLRTTAGAGGAPVVADARASFVSLTDVPDVLDLTPAVGGLGPADLAAAAGTASRLPEAVAERLAELVSDHVDPATDIHAYAQYRRHLAVVLTRRTLECALERAATTAGHGGRS